MIYASIVLHIAGGVAVSGLAATTSVGIEYVECPRNSTFPNTSQCSGTTPQFSRCLSNFSAAGIHCIQGQQTT